VGRLLISTAVAAVAVLASAAVAVAAPAEAPASSSSLVDRCISDGRASDPACADARYPEDRAEADVATLCRAMPDMAGCTLRRLCKSGGAPSSSSSSSSPFCEPFSLLASLCEEMPTMRGCGAYVALCGRERNAPLPPPQPIAQCRQHPAPEKLVGSDDARRLVREACAEMPMAGCALCAPTGGVDACPDPLRALSAVCLEMGGMRQCAALDAMCAAERRRAGGGNSDNTSDNSPIRELCGGQRDSLPPMQMWFHQRVSEVLLWRSWVPRTAAAYAGCVVALLSFGVASVALKTARGRFEAQWIHDSLCSRSPARRAAAAAAEAEAAVAAAAASWGNGKGGKAAGVGSSGSDEGIASGGSGGSACCGGEGAPIAPAVVAPPSSGSSSKGRRRRFPAALLPLSSSSAATCPDHDHHHQHHHHHRGSARVATCCERHAALGPRTPLQRAANSLLFANCVRAMLVGAAAVFDYFNMLAVMTFNAGFFAAVVCGYALGTLLLSHLVVPAPMQQQQGRGAPSASAAAASGAPFAGSAASRGRRRRAFGWIGKARGGGKAGSNGAVAGGAAAAAAGGAAAANGGACGGGNDVEAPREQQQRQSNQDVPEDPDIAVARHVASSAACEACC
jgi:hypothetical protein